MDEQTKQAFLAVINGQREFAEALSNLTAEDESLGDCMAAWNFTMLKAVGLESEATEDERHYGEMDFETFEESIYGGDYHSQNGPQYIMAHLGRRRR